MFQDRLFQNGKSKKGRKVLLVILLLYLLVCVYKFIAFTRFYLIANSFSEEKYSMTTSLKIPNEPNLKDAYFDTTRVGNKIIEKSYDFVDMEPKDEKGNVLPYDINYTGLGKYFWRLLTHVIIMCQSEIVNLEWLHLSMK